MDDANLDPWECEQAFWEVVKKILALQIAQTKRGKHAQRNRIRKG